MSSHHPTIPRRARAPVRRGGARRWARTESAGAAGSALPSSCSTRRTSSIYRNLAEILREAYSKVGVELVLRPLDWAAYSQRFGAGSTTLAPYGNTPLPPKIDPKASYHSSQIPPNGQNTGYYKNPEADRLMEAAAAEMDESQAHSSSTARCTASSPRTLRRTFWDAEPVLGDLQAARRRRDVVHRSLSLPPGSARLAPGGRVAVGGPSMTAPLDGILVLDLTADPRGARSAR